MTDIALYKFLKDAPGDTYCGRHGRVPAHVVAVANAELRLCGECFASAVALGLHDLANPKEAAEFGGPELQAAVREQARRVRELLELR